MVMSSGIIFENFDKLRHFSFLLDERKFVLDGGSSY
jgi:hypothetical protein